jgi:hypothetical protein
MIQHQYAELVMGIKLSTEDQIKLLRDTAKHIDERIKYLAKVDFDECLLSYVIDLYGIEDVITDSCIFSLKTEDEIDDEAENLRQESDYRSYSRTIYNENKL